MLQALSVIAAIAGYVSVSASWEGQTEPPLIIETGDDFQPVWPRLRATPLPSPLPSPPHPASSVQDEDDINLVHSSPLPASAQFPENPSRILDGNQTKLDPFLDENFVKNIYSDVLNAFFKNNTS